MYLFLIASRYDTDVCRGAHSSLSYSFLATAFPTTQGDTSRDLHVKKDEGKRGGRRWGNEPVLKNRKSGVTPVWKGTSLYQKWPSKRVKENLRRKWDGRGGTEEIQGDRETRVGRTTSGTSLHKEKEPKVHSHSWGVPFYRPQILDPRIDPSRVKPRRHPRPEGVSYHRTKILVHGTSPSHSLSVYLPLPLSTSESLILSLWLSLVPSTTLFDSLYRPLDLSVSLWLSLPLSQLSLTRRNTNVRRGPFSATATRHDS